MEVTRVGMGNGLMDQEAFTRSVRELLSAAINVSGTDLEACIDQVLVATSDVLEADGAALLLLDEQDELRLTGTSDEPARVLESAQIRLGAGPAIDSMAGNEVVAVADLRRVAGYVDLGELVAPAGVRSVLAVPLIVQGDAVGALNVYRSTPYEWPPEDRAAGQAYATLLGLLLRVAVEAGFETPAARRIVARAVDRAASGQGDAAGGWRRHAGRS